MLIVTVVKLLKTGRAAQILFAPEKVDSLHLCVDYHRRSAVTKRGSYPISPSDECIYSLGKAPVFSTIDANSG